MRPLRHGWARALHSLIIVILLLVPLPTLAAGIRTDPAGPTPALDTSVPVVGTVAQPDARGGATGGLGVMALALMTPTLLLALTLSLSAVERRLQ